MKKLLFMLLLSSTLFLSACGANAVELTIPASYVEGQAQEDLDKLCKEKGYKSITLNDDGSATYVITEKQHKKMMDEI